MKKTITLVTIALLLGSCAFTKEVKNCRITGSGAYKGQFRVCLECDTTATHFKQHVAQKFEQQKKK